MPSLNETRKALASLPPERKVAVFVGGTSGIGEAAVTSFARWATGHAYIIGRNAASAAKTMAACRAVAASPSTTFEFIQQDIVLLRDVDAVCAAIASRQTQLDLLYMTPDIPTFSGRVETSEAIDRLMSLRYYARMRFIRNLLPLLRRAPSPRVISVLGPKKFEFGLDLDDLALRSSYGNVACFSHCSLMNTLCMEEYALRNPSVAFVHVYPGVVLTTNVLSGPDLPWLVRKLIQYLVYPVCRLFAQKYPEAGDRMMYIAFSGIFPAAGADGAGDVQVASDGEAGSGCYCVDWKARRMDNARKLASLRLENARRKVWDHTDAVLNGVPRVA